jgi:hypothetical protein
MTTRSAPESSSSTAQASTRKAEHDQPQGLRPTRAGTTASDHGDRVASGGIDVKTSFDARLLTAPIDGIRRI